jgi:predicted SnoaL-like aldol condensation-catalyzing enzyme
MSFLEILVRAPVCVYDTEGNIRDWLHHYHHHSPGVIDGRKGFLGYLPTTSF